MIITSDHVSAAIACIADTLVDLGKPLDVDTIMGAAEHALTGENGDQKLLATQELGEHAVAAAIDEIAYYAERP